MHDCKQTYETKTGETFYNFTCSRCGGCYVCRHKALLFQDGTWHWKCRDKIREVILDGKVKA